MRTRSGVIAAIVVSAGAAPAFAIVSSATDALAGIYINDLLGASAFYDAGYTGTRAVAANIEAGHAWGGAAGHETLGHLTTFINREPVVNQLGELDMHATWTAQALAGRATAGGNANAQRGIAYGATLWSGAIASTFASGGAFNFASWDYLRNPYRRILSTGVDGVTADVVNSSWGSTGTAAASAGNTFLAGFIDALVNTTGKIVVVAAGNSGSGPDTIWAPASGYNAIAVANLGNHDNAYDQVHESSSRSPSAFFNPQTGVTIQGVRARIDIAAPGNQLKLAAYGGTTGGNTGGADFTGGQHDQYMDFLNGTSFAAPTVAGGAALVVDYGKDRHAGGESIDVRVVKAVLLNSAEKIPGWDNGQSTVGGVVTTTQSLDWASGAGRMNLAGAFDQYRQGVDRTSNLLGLVGGEVEATGWDFGRVQNTTPNTYTIDTPLMEGSLFTATLTWLVDRTANVNDGTSAVFTDQSFDNLDLEVWSMVNGSLVTMVATSASLYNNTEHLHFTLPAGGLYAIRVVWTGEAYDRIADTNRETYGLAWDATPIPAPGVLVMLALVAVRRRSRAR